MANKEVTGGVGSYLLFGEESTYGTAASVTENLGLIQNYKFTITNNTTGHRGFKNSDTSGRNVQKYTNGVMDVSGSVEFQVQNFRWFKHVLGSESGTDPYTYSESDYPASLTIAECIDNPGDGSTDEEQAFVGTVIESATLRTSVGEPVSASLDLKSSNAISDSSISSNVEAEDEAVYNFSGGDIELPDGTSIPNIIDSVELSITNNWEMLSGVGSRLVQNAVPKARDYSVKMTVKYLDTDLVDAAKGAATPLSDTTPTEYATLILNFTNGSRSMAITCTGVIISEFSRNDELNNPISEDMTFMVKSVEAVEDNT